MKLGTHSGDRMYVRRLASSRNKEIVLGAMVEVRHGRAVFEKWQGPLKVYAIGEPTECRLFLEWM